VSYNKTINDFQLDGYQDLLTQGITCACVKQAGLFCLLWIKCDFFLLSDSTVAIHSHYEHFLEDIIYIGTVIVVL